MTAARTFRSDGTIQPSGLAAVPRETVTDEDAKDPKALAAILTRVLATQNDLLRRIGKPSVDFEDVPVTGTGALIQLEHRLGARVRWLVVDWSSTAGGQPPVFEKDPSTTANLLVLSSTEAGTVTIRVEVA